MKKLLLLTCLMVSACCHDEKNQEPLVCEWTGSFNDFPWMMTMKEGMTNCTCLQSVFQATYKHQTVFYHALSDPRCDGVFAPTLYNCQGQPVRTFSASMEDYNEFFEVVTDIKAIFSCEQ